MWTGVRPNLNLNLNLNHDRFCKLFSCKTQLLHFFHDIYSNFEFNTLGCSPRASARSASLYLLAKDARFELSPSTILQLADHMKFLKKHFPFMIVTRFRKM